MASLAVAVASMEVPLPEVLQELKMAPKVQAVAQVILVASIPELLPQDNVPAMATAALP